MSDRSTHLEIIPLGGCGEFGNNLTCYRHGEALVAVDCGTMFADDLPGVDHLIPDLTVLERERKQLIAYVITHGHEDHFGALPYALAVAPAPVYATALTLDLIRRRLIDHPAQPRRRDLRLLAPGPPVDLGGGISVEAIRVAHSVPQAVALALRTPAGMVVHTGDFKLNHTEEHLGFDSARFAALGEEGVLAAISDSTNALHSGYAPGEARVRAALDGVIASAPARVFVAHFASNLARLQATAQLAKKHGRRLLLAGRSLRQFAEIGEAQGLLRFPPATRAPLARFANLPPEQVVVALTGGQAEARSALWRVSRGEHAELELAPGDVVVISSRVIPGREKAVAQMIDDLLRRGAQVVDERVLPGVHASGHGYAEDLRALLDLLRPSALLPVHGGLRMQRAHAAIGKQAGVPQILIPENGERIAASQAGVRSLGVDRAERQLVLAGALHPETGPLLGQRQGLATGGVIACTLIVDRRSGDILEGPHLAARGVPETDRLAQGPLIEQATHALVKALATEPKLPADLAVFVTKRLRRFFRDRLPRRPVVLPIIVERASEDPGDS